MNRRKPLLFAFIVPAAILLTMGTAQGDFYARDCSGLIGEEGVVKYDTGIYKDHSPLLCGAPRWGFGGDNAYCQFPSREGPQGNTPFWMNYYDPDTYTTDGVYWVPAYAGKSLFSPWRYPTYQGFFDEHLDPEYWEVMRRPENLVEVRIQSVPSEYDWGQGLEWMEEDHSDGHFRFRVKKLKANQLSNFRYRIDWSQPAPDHGGTWLNVYYEMDACWDLKVFRPMHRFIQNGENPTAWERTERGIAYPDNDWDDRTNYKCMYTIPLPYGVDDEYEIEVSAQIPYVLGDLDDFLTSIAPKISAADSMPDWTVTLRTIGYGGLQFALNPLDKEMNPIQVLEIDSHSEKHCVVMSAGVHYEPPGNFLMEAVVEEILDNIIQDDAEMVDFSLILMANPDAYVWGNAHPRPYGTRYDGENWVKDLDLENGQHWWNVFPPYSDQYKQNDVEAVTLQDYIADLLTSSKFQHDGTEGTIPILHVDLHADVCPHPIMWSTDNSTQWTRAPGNYAQAFAKNFEAYETLRTTFAQRLVEFNPFMRPCEEWMCFEYDHLWFGRIPQFPGSGFEYLLASVVLEYDEVALYQDVTDYGDETPTPVCTAYTPVYREDYIRVYTTPGDTGNRPLDWRTYRVSCYHDEGATYFQDWGVDLAHACADFVQSARPRGVPTPTPAPTYTPVPTPTPGGPPTPDPMPPSYMH